MKFLKTLSILLLLSSSVLAKPVKHTPKPKQPAESRYLVMITDQRTVLGVMTTEKICAATALALSRYLPGPGIVFDCQDKP